MASSTYVVMMMIGIVASTMVATCAGGNFQRDFEITWGDHRARIFGRGGNFLSLTMDRASGSGFRSKKAYLFGRIDMDIKLVPGNSAGTVTTFYLSSEGPTHDEIDFEFLGNASGEPYTLHTNVYAQGRGNREQQFKLWFDPTRNFHTYSIDWKPQHITFLVDNIPIRVYKNAETLGVPFPKNQPMKIYSSLWNADDWATQGGRVKTDWSKAPFTAYYRNFRDSTFSTRNTRLGGAWQDSDLQAWGRRKLRWVQRKYMIYNYCTDYKRFWQGIPAECSKARI